MKKKMNFWKGIDFKVIATLAIIVSILTCVLFLFLAKVHKDRLVELQADVAALEERKISANDIAYQIETWHRHPYSVHYWRKIHHISMYQLIDLLLEHFEIKVVPEETTTKRKPLRLEKRK